MRALQHRHRARPSQVRPVEELQQQRPIRPVRQPLAHRRRDPPVRHVHLPRRHRNHLPDQVVRIRDRQRLHALVRVALRDKPTVGPAQPDPARQIPRLHQVVRVPRRPILKTRVVQKTGNRAARLHQPLRRVVEPDRPAEPVGRAHHADECPAVNRSRRCHAVREQIRPCVRRVRGCERRARIACQDIRARRIEELQHHHSLRVRRRGETIRGRREGIGRRFISVALRRRPCLRDQRAREVNLQRVVAAAMIGVKHRAGVA